MLTVKAIIVAKMTSHCAGTVQMREESERWTRKWKEIWFKMRAEDGERGQRTAVTCDGRLFHRQAAATKNALSPTVDRRVTSNILQSRWWAERIKSIKIQKCLNYLCCNVSNCGLVPTNVKHCNNYPAEMLLSRSLLHFICVGLRLLRYNFTAFR